MTPWLTTLLLFSAVGDAPVLRDTVGQRQIVAVTPGNELLVVAFLAVECPLAKLYAERLNEIAEEYHGRGVRVFGIDSHRHDSLSDLRRFTIDHRLQFPLAKDLGTTLADRLGVLRTPAVVVLDKQQRVRYHGRVDDQYQLGARRTAPESHDLRRALDELLSGRPVSISQTVATGCLISRPAETARPSNITFTEQIAPLLQAKCASCHRAGGMGPMPLDDYAEVAGWGAMIAEVVSQGRMPPWHADERFGHFANDPSLTAAERELIADWVADGCLRGEGKAPRQQPSLESANVWSIGAPDLVVAMPTVFQVPATGVLEYQTFDVDPGFTTDRWATALEIRPGNRAVVHHCNVFLCPPGSGDAMEAGSLGSVCLAAMAAGTSATVLPEGMAKRIPAGWRLRFVMHYVPNGVAQGDRTELGMKFCAPEQVTREVATRLLVDEHLRIPPGESNHRVEQATVCERDLLLLAMFPHLHLRGKSFRYEAAYPDGRQETLLFVPRWDFDWQHRYELATPKRLPAGTVIRCTAVYDNSADNPANPDPAAEVHTGPRSDDEMFNGYYDVAVDGPMPTGELPWHFWLTRGALVTMLGGVLIRRKASAAIQRWRAN